MNPKRKLKVKIQNPLGLFNFDGVQKDIRLTSAPEFKLLERSLAEQKSLELFRYSDPDRTLRIYLLAQGATCTVIGSLTLMAGSPGERAVTELMKNRRMQGIEYDLARMMSELVAYKYRRAFGEDAARPAAPGEEGGYFLWNSPTVDLGAPRVLVFSAADMMYLTGCYDQRLEELLEEELILASRSLSLGYQCHVTMCEFFDSFVEAHERARQKSGRFFSEVAPAARVIGSIDRKQTREFFRRMDRAYQLQLKVRRQEDETEERLWRAQMEAGEAETESET